jgi:hypothetical protein
MKIAHEAPISIFHWMQNHTDYDYALVHMFEESKEYYDCFERALSKGREVILDNSIFELGVAFDRDKYVHWINKLKPTWYIIPDVLEDTNGTIESFHKWNSLHGIKVNPNVKKIGVIQGKTFNEIVECYKTIAPNVDKVAISFDFSYYTESTKSLDPINKYAGWMFGRQRLLKDLLDAGIIDTNKPHHLLGCALPQEFSAYKNYKWIDSVDTSNPVVHGINRVRYSDHGLNEKISTKLIDYMFETLNYDQLSDVEYNVNNFRKFCK